MLCLFEITFLSPYIYIYIYIYIYKLLKTTKKHLCTMKSTHCLFGLSAVQSEIHFNLLSLLTFFCMFGIVCVCVYMCWYGMCVHESTWTYITIVRDKKLTVLVLS